MGGGGVMRREPLKAVGYFLLAIAVTDLVLLFSGYRVLIGETRGTEWTDVGKLVESEKIGDTLTCRYFTGRGVLTETLGPYGPILAECPFFFKPHY